MRNLSLLTECRSLPELARCVHHLGQSSVVGNVGSRTRIRASMPRIVNWIEV